MTTIDYTYANGHWTRNAPEKRHVWRTIAKAIAAFAFTAIVMTAFAWLLLKGWERQEFVDQARVATYLQWLMESR